MRVAVTGATGTIGSALCAALHARGDEVMALSRNAESARKQLEGTIDRCVTWADPTRTPAPPRRSPASTRSCTSSANPSTNAGTRRPNSASATRRLLRALRRHTARRDLARRRGFLAGVVVVWEHEAQQAEAFMRVVTARTGVVLSPSGGALATMVPIFRAGLGGQVAGGRQWVPWVHLDDIVGGLVHCLDDASLAGPVNLTAPTPVTNAEFTKALGRVLRRPTILPLPGIALSLLYGEMSDVITSGRRVLPGAPHRHGLRVRASDDRACAARRARPLMPVHRLPRRSVRSPLLVPRSSPLEHDCI
jgi:NAD dependent epimerase/dehydratase family enzyme